MAGYHSTAIASVKVVIQNKTTGLYLCPKGYWGKERRVVSFPDKGSITRECMRLNATCEIVTK